MVNDATRHSAGKKYTLMKQRTPYNSELKLARTDGAIDTPPQQPRQFVE